MGRNTFRSIGAVIAGFAVITVLSTAADTVLENAGVLPEDTLPLVGDDLLLGGVLGYRAAFSLAGCYLAARLAPSRPMWHALALGVAGVVLSALGSVAMSDSQPVWFGVVLTLMALPVAWLGGKLYLATSHHGTKMTVT